MVTPAPAAAPGFFGKLRSHGDFVGRRLPHAMLQPFDMWVQAGLRRSRADLGADWLPAWLSSPLWRFVLAPGLCGPHAWCGVMMPSVDRVGRCFPLTLAAGMATAPALHDCLLQGAAWFARLEDLALASMEDDALARLDAGLQALGAAPMAAAQGDHLPPPSIRRQAVLLVAGRVPRLANDGLTGRTAWWTDGSAQVAPVLATCAGMPPASGFAALLDGRWAERGWDVMTNDFLRDVPDSGVGNRFTICRYRHRTFNRDTVLFSLERNGSIHGGGNDGL